jgi:hypothetical protein
MQPPKSVVNAGIIIIGDEILKGQVPIPSISLDSIYCIYTVRHMY